MKHLPNLLTLLRLLMVPLFPLVYFSGRPDAVPISLGIFLLAGITDVLDGQIARRFNLISRLGTVLDPLADKLMLLTALASLAFEGTIPPVIFWILLLKEGFMIVVASIMYFRREKFVIPSNLFGKLATVLFFVAVPLNMLFPGNPWTLALMVVAFLLKLLALYHYIGYYRQNRKKQTP